jgi:hypothetical protein
VGSVRGVVTFSAGASSSVLSGATVRVRGLNGEFEAITDRDGRYAFWAIPPGKYWVEAQAGGYRGWPFMGRLPVCVRAGQNSFVRLALDNHVRTESATFNQQLSRAAYSRAFTPESSQTASLYSLGSC